MGRTTVGYVIGNSGRFGRVPFFRVRLPKTQVQELDLLLARTDGHHRRTATITCSYHQPDRLRVTEVEPPEYELRAAAQYVRGDAIRVQGKEGVSCGLDISSRFGVPLVREQLRLAAERAKAFVELRVPSRKWSLIEFLPDRDIHEADDVVSAEALVLASSAALHPEDFSDWED